MVQQSNFSEKSLNVLSLVRYHSLCGSQAVTRYVVSEGSSRPPLCFRFDYISVEATESRVSEDTVHYFVFLAAT